MSRYATPADLDISGIPLAALASLEKSLVQTMLDRMSSFADTFLGDKYTLPLLPPFDPSLTDAVCAIAAWRLLARRGYDPDSDGDKVVRQLYLDAIDFLKRVANGQARLAVVQSAPASLQPDVSSNLQRGYGDIVGDGATDYPQVPGNGSWGT